jgi:hypothetical protein
MSLASAHLVLCRPAGDAKQRSLVSKPGADVAQPSEGDLTPLNHLQESIYICRSVSTQHREKEAPQNTTTSSAGAASRCAAAAAVGSRAVLEVAPPWICRPPPERPPPFLDLPAKELLLYLRHHHAPALPPCRAQTPSRVATRAAGGRREGGRRPPAQARRSLLPSHAPAEGGGCRRFRPATYQGEYPR